MLGRLPPTVEELRICTFPEQGSQPLLTSERVRLSSISAISVWVLLILWIIFYVGEGGRGGGGSCSVQCGISNSISGLYAPDAPITVTTKMSPGIVRYPLESKIALVENHQSSNLTKQVQTPKPTCLNDHLLAGVCIAGPEHLSCPYSWPDDHACPILTTTLFSGMYVGPWLGELEHSFGHNPALFNLLTLFC